MLRINRVNIHNNLNIRNNNNKRKNNATISIQNSSPAIMAKIPSLTTLQAYNNVSFRGGFNIKYITPDGIQPTLEYLKGAFNKAQQKLISSESYASWRDLPAKLIKDEYVDKIYNTIEKFKKPFGKDSKLIFIGLGNPANADEAANVLGVGQNVVHLCGTTKGEAIQAINKAGGNLDKIQVIVSSKSGTTFESNESYKLIRKQLVKHYKENGTPKQEIDKAISKHFLCLTDKNPQATLKKEAIKKGYATIDCIDGLPSGFGDLAYDMPVLAYTGIPKEEMNKMLVAADKMNKKLLTSDFEHNIAGQMAAFDKFAIDNGATKEQFLFHSTLVSMPSTIRQLYEESLRKINLGTLTLPRSAHSSLEASINRKLPGQPINIITDITISGRPKKSAYLEKALIQNIKQEGHYQKIIKFPMSKNGEHISPEAFFKFLVLKSHLAYYKNELEGTKHALDKIDYVKGYKETFKNLVEENKPLN